MRPHPSPPVPCLVVLVVLLLHAVACEEPVRAEPSAKVAGVPQALRVVDALHFDERGLPGWTISEGVETSPVPGGAAAFHAEGLAELTHAVEFDAREVNAVALGIDNASVSTGHLALAWITDEDQRWNLRYARAADRLTDTPAGPVATFVTARDPRWRGTIRGLRILMAGVRDFELRFVTLLELEEDAAAELLSPSTDVVRLGKETRRVLANPSHSLDVTAGSRVEVGFGAEFDVKNPEGNAVRFTVTALRDGGEEDVLFDRTLDPAARPDERGWFEAQVDVGAAGGGDVRLWLRATQVGEGAPRTPRWTPPLVLGQRASPEAPNVVLISLDTLRADHLGCYGYERPTSPHIDALAEDGVLFEHAVSQSSWTLPAHASLMSGLWPSRHGAIMSNSRIAEDAPMLGEIMNAAGYLTAAFTEGIYVRGDLGFARGFARYDDGDTKALTGEKGVSDTLAKASRWIEQHADQRFFLFVHTYQVHMPYYAPDQLYLEFGPAPPEETARVSEGLAHSINEQGMEREEGATFDTQLDRFVAYYDAGIRFTDRFVGELLDTLDAAGLRDNTIVILTSDHGDDLLDHYLLARHGHSHHREVVEVPLIVRAPGVAPGRSVSRPVALLDVMPTIVDLAGAEVPEGIDAVSLVDDLRGEASPAASRPIVSLTTHDLQSIDLSVRTARYSYHYRHELTEQRLNRMQSLLGLSRWHGQARDIPAAEELFDLEADPHETVNLVAELPDVAAELRAIALAEIEGIGEIHESQTQFDAELVEQLQALGYTGK